jgi:hypothetical protein
MWLKSNSVELFLVVHRQDVRLNHNDVSQHALQHVPLVPSESAQQPFSKHARPRFPSAKTKMMDIVRDDRKAKLKKKQSDFHQMLHEYGKKPSSRRLLGILQLH